MRKWVFKLPAEFLGRTAIALEVFVASICRAVDWRGCLSWRMDRMRCGVGAGRLF